MLVPPWGFLRHHSKQWQQEGGVDLTTQVLGRNLQTERFLSFLRAECLWDG